MSVKTMAQVWDLDLPRDEKFVLLAYADHADHNGDNIFPSVETIKRKTGYSERSVQEITRSLEKNGWLVPAGKGPKGTNKWSFGGAKTAPAEFAPVQSGAGGGAEPTGEGVRPTAPEPLRTIKEPSVKASAKAHPEIMLFKSVTFRYPPRPNFEDVVSAVQKAAARLGRDLTREDLLPFYKTWTGKGYNPAGLGWLEWAVSGVIPQNRRVKQSGADIARKWLEKQGG